MGKLLGVAILIVALCIGVKSCNDSSNSVELREAQVSLINLREDNSNLKGDVEHYKIEVSSLASKLDSVSDSKVQTVYVVNKGLTSVMYMVISLVSILGIYLVLWVIYSFRGKEKELQSYGEVLSGKLTSLEKLALGYHKESQDNLKGTMDNIISLEKEYRAYSSDASRLLIELSNGYKEQQVQITSVDKAVTGSTLSIKLLLEDLQIVKTNYITTKQLDDSLGLVKNEAETATISNKLITLGSKLSLLETALNNKAGNDRVSYLEETTKMHLDLISDQAKLLMELTEEKQ